MRRMSYLLAVALLFAIPWENAVQIAGIGRISKLLGITVGVIWLISVLSRRRIRPVDKFHMLVVLYVVWSGLTLFWSIDARATMSGFMTNAQLLVMLLLIWDLFDSRRKIEVGLQAYVLGAFITAGSVTFDFFTSPAARFPLHTRFSGLGPQVDGVALIVAIAAPAAWYLAAGPNSTARTVVMRVINYMYLPLAFLALAFTGTRGAALASIPTLVLVLWSLTKATGRWRAVGVGTVLAATATIMWFAPPELLGRIGSAVTERGTEGSLGGRWGLWMESISAFAERPVAGVGLEAHRAAIPTGKEAHNMYISVLTETGLVGFLFFMGVIGTVIASVLRHQGWDRWYWSVQLLVIAIGGMSLTITDFKSVWIMVALAVGSAATSQVQPRSIERQPKRALTQQE